MPHDHTKYGQTISVTASENAFYSWQLTQVDVGIKSWNSKVSILESMT